MNEINLLYIDDEYESNLVEYLIELENTEQFDNFKLNFEQYEYDIRKDYKQLITLNKVIQANIIIIDSKLFKETDHVTSKFYGETFVLILETINPYIKTIILSQDMKTFPEIKIEKFKDDNANLDYKDYYDEKLKPLLQRYISEIRIKRSLIGELEKVDKLLKDNIKNQILGLSSYSNFEKSDLDQLIKEFQNIREYYEKKNRLS